MGTRGGDSGEGWCVIELEISPTASKNSKSESWMNTSARRTKIPCFCRCRWMKAGSRRTRVELDTEVELEFGSRSL